MTIGKIKKILAPEYRSLKRKIGKYGCKRSCNDGAYNYYIKRKKKNQYKYWIRIVRMNRR